jgi:hypothetical protein
LDVSIIDKISKLLHEYEDLFPTKFTDMKGIKGPMGEMKIPLKPDARLVKQRPYRLNPKYDRMRILPVYSDVVQIEECTSHLF